MDKVLLYLNAVYYIRAMNIAVSMTGVYKVKTKALCNWSTTCIMLLNLTKDNRDVNNAMHV